jgi:hypothetical protein
VLTERVLTSQQSGGKPRLGVERSTDADHVSGPTEQFVTVVSLANSTLAENGHVDGLSDLPADMSVPARFGGELPRL